jgi:hypothetical protein
MINSEEKLLLVEGKDDQYAVINLLKPHIGWEEGNKPVQIESCEGNNLLDSGVIPLHLKAANTKILGIVLDAEGDCQGRWKRIRQLCLPCIPNIPEELPQVGLVIPSKSKQERRFGVWIMPNNQHPGMLETFLKGLVPEKYKCLLSYAEIASKRAKLRFGAPYGDTHYDKALMHTWLAWMEPPGKPFGTAFLAQILDTDADTAVPFLNWFRNLYEFNDQVARG